MLYGRLDVLRSRGSDRLARAVREAGGTHQARSEREAFSAMSAQQLSRFDAAETGLCCGRLDFDDGERRYIGRIGIHDESGDYEQLLMDWRASAARPFYLATAASPADVRRRRHIKTRGRTVVSLDDEVLDLKAADPAQHEGLTGESALMAALGASRTGQMRDIVETIPAEQDRIIRSRPARGRSGRPTRRCAATRPPAPGPGSAPGAPAGRTTRRGGSSPGRSSTRSPSSSPPGSAPTCWARPTCSTRPTWTTCGVSCAGTRRCGPSSSACGRSSRRSGCWPICSPPPTGSRPPRPGSPHRGPVRRCPARSMTIVGDVAQTGDPAGTSSWERVLDRYQGDRWRLAPLTINYRTPAEIMTVAADVLAAIDPALELPRSVRESGTAPWRLEVAPGELADAPAGATKRASARLGDGRLAVIVPAAPPPRLGPPLRDAVPGSPRGEPPAPSRPAHVPTLAP